MHIISTPSSRHFFPIKYNCANLNINNFSIYFLIIFENNAIFFNFVGKLYVLSFFLDLLGQDMDYALVVPAYNPH